MTQEEKDKYFKWGFVVLAVFVVFLWPHTSIWEGEGEVSLFPEDAAAKNYRLPAQVGVTQKYNGFGFHKSYIYKVSEATWPNEGYATFEDCYPTDKERATCSDQNNTQYGVEVNVMPEAPDADYDSEY